MNVILPAGSGFPLNLTCPETLAFPEQPIIAKTIAMSAAKQVTRLINRRILAAGMNFTYVVGFSLIEAVSKRFKSYSVDRTGRRLETPGQGWNR
jgi:hypothetical protein